MERSMPAIRVSSAGKLFVFLLTVGTAAAQIYPPGTYPPVGYPGGYPTPGIPLPGRTGGKAQPNSSTKGPPLPSFHGKLKQMDAKSILLSLDDDRMLVFTRDSKTKFYKDGKEIKDPKFNANDQL